jgi:hypothetical protein
MSKLIFHSDRRFRLFSYNAGHGLLLLRSGKTAQHSTRLDVLFQDVRAMEIRSWSDGIEIREIPSEQLVGFKSNPLEMVERGNQVYALKGRGWEGFIVGGIVSVAEDTSDFMAQSKLLPE